MQPIPNRIPQNVFTGSNQFLDSTTPSLPWCNPKEFPPPVNRLLLVEWIDVGDEPGYSLATFDGSYYWYDDDNNTEIEGSSIRLYLVIK